MSGACLLSVSAISVSGKVEILILLGHINKFEKITENSPNCSLLCASLLSFSQEFRIQRLLIASGVLIALRKESKGLHKKRDVTATETVVERRAEKGR